MFRTVCVAAAFLLAPALALAHPGELHTHVGVLAGLLHPLTGLDHLLAMLAVGWWAVATQAKRWWATPLAFALATLAGAAIGAVTSFTVPGIEWLIAGSVVVFGALMMRATRVSTLASAAIAAGFGAFHGLAHGVELSGDGGIGAWILGMAAGTLVLHLAGAVAGRFATKHAQWITRSAGAMTAVVGVALLGGVL